MNSKEDVVLTALVFHHIGRSHYFQDAALIHSRKSNTSKSGAVVGALASYQCGPGSNSGVNAICGLSLLLVLSLDLKGSSLGTPVFLSP